MGRYALRCAKSLKALLHWVKYFYRISTDPTTVDMDEVIFIQQLDTAMLLGPAILGPSTIWLS